MGKRSNFERRERDFYPTPWEAVQPLRPHLYGYTQIVEPCAGDATLCGHLTKCGFEIVHASDIEPRADEVFEFDYRELVDVPGEIAVTNPPWGFETVENLVSTSRLVWRLPIWLLLSADFAHNRQSARLLKHCERIVSIGRVKWIPDSPHAGKDNCAWYLFNPQPVAVTAFYGRR